MNRFPVVNSNTCQAIILAAGRGERMRPLTDSIPKPMIEVWGRPLIGWHLRALVKAGIRNVMINVAWLEDVISEQIGAVYNCEYGKLNVYYSREFRDFGYALETAGGVYRVLPKLDPIFWIISADIFVPQFEFILDSQFIDSEYKAKLWLVANPKHLPEGNFWYHPQTGALSEYEQSQCRRLTYSGIGLFKKEFFTQANCSIESGNFSGKILKLAALFNYWIRSIISEEYLKGWEDVGTLDRLDKLAVKSIDG
ncbi:MAG: sugar phosphate nucleotidyltransferase [Gammaproteobacteria bacterium]|nr:sugar phosphate nucleotidyltransferase [Gammaproteobacteria bacterium]